MVLKSLLEDYIIPSRARTVPQQYSADCIITNSVATARNNTQFRTRYNFQQTRNDL